VKLTDQEFSELRRWQLRNRVLFTGIWLYFIAVIAVHALSDVRPVVIQIALIPLLGLLIVAILSQFSARCPACGYRIGRQSGLIVPEHCRGCGVALRQERDAG
jgi:hypothetical protein